MFLKHFYVFYTIYNFSNRFSYFSKHVLFLLNTYTNKRGSPGSARFCPILAEATEKVKILPDPEKGRPVLPDPEITGSITTRLSMLVAPVSARSWKKSARFCPVLKWEPGSRPVLPDPELWKPSCLQKKTFCSRFHHFH